MNITQRNYMPLDSKLDDSHGLNLNEGEILLWFGKPRSGVVFRRSDLLMISVQLIWVGIFFNKVWTHKYFNVSNLHMIVLVPILIAALYITVGRFFMDALKRSKTTYDITKDRIIIQSGIFRTTTTSHNIKGISKITWRKEWHNSGTVLLGSSNFVSFYNEGTPWFRNRVTPRLEFIKDSKTVYEKILELQKT